MTVDLGLMALTQHPDNRDPAVCMDETVRQARTASDYGFASLFVGEHRFTEDIYFDNFTALAGRRSSPGRASVYSHCTIRD